MSQHLAVNDKGAVGGMQHAGPSSRAGHTRLTPCAGNAAPRKEQYIRNEVFAHTHTVPKCYSDSLMQTHSQKSW